MDPQRKGINALTASAWQSPLLFQDMETNSILSFSAAMGESDNRWYARSSATRGFATMRRNAAENASNAVMAIGSQNPDTDTGETEAKRPPPSSQRNKAVIKAKKYRYKTFPAILSAAFPEGLIDNEQDPSKGKFHPDYTKRQRTVIATIDRWIDSFVKDGQFLLEEMAVKTYGLMMPTIRPADN